MVHFLSTTASLSTTAATQRLIRPICHSCRPLPDVVARFSWRHSTNNKSNTTALLLARLLPPQPPQPHNHNYQSFPASSPAAHGFHTSSVASFPIRRRPKQGRTSFKPENEEMVYLDDDGNKQSSHNEGAFSSSSSRKKRIWDFDTFEREADQLLDKLYEAILPMKPQNDIFILNRGQENGVGPNVTVNLGPIVGTHCIQVDYTQFAITYKTPVSGQYSYELIEQESGTEGVMELNWRNITDGHSLEGMVVRDLLKSANGCPKV